MSCSNVCCMLYVSCSMLHVSSCMLHVSSCMLHVSIYMLHVCMSHISCSECNWFWWYTCCWYRFHWIIYFTTITNTDHQSSIISTIYSTMRITSYQHIDHAIHMTFQSMHHVNIHVHGRASEDTHHDSSTAHRSGFMDATEPHLDWWAYIWIWNAYLITQRWQVSCMHMHMYTYHTISYHTMYYVPCAIISTSLL